MFIEAPLFLGQAQTFFLNTAHLFKFRKQSTGLNR